MVRAVVRAGVRAGAAPAASKVDIIELASIQPANRKDTGHGNVK